MRKLAKRSSLRKFALLAAVAVLALTTIQAALAAGGQPDGITDEAKDMHRLYLLVLAIAGVVFVGVESVLVYILIRFRRRDDKLPPQTHGNNAIEVLWTAIPVMIVLILFVFQLVVLLRVEHGEDPKDMTVEVTGFQFSWKFVYNLNDLGTKSDPNSKAKVTVQGTGAEEPTLVIPVGERVEFKLASNDVIHSFYVRDFLYKLDVIPGRDNRFSITARETGTFVGQCAELCGLNHALMRFKVQVVSRDEFDKWVADTVASTQKAALKP
jgi:cytochrome c oxidase subunit 2